MNEPTNSQIEQAAIILMSLPADNSAAIMQRLDEEQIKELGIAMANIKNINADKRNQAIQSFFEEANTKTALGVNSDQFIKKVMDAAIGEDKSVRLLDKIFSEQESGNKIDNLKWMSVADISEMLTNEHPQIQAIVLSCLSPETSAQVLNTFDDDVKTKLLLRLSKLEEISSEALETVNHLVQNKFQQTAEGSSKRVSGIKTAANIMNFFNKELEGRINEKITALEPDLLNKIQDQMFIFENLLDVEDRGIQTLLREVSTDQLVIALKGADENLREKIFSNMSKRAGDMLRDDLEAKGPVKLSEVEAMQKEILKVAKKLADAGEINLGGAGAEEML